jgi:hypothetical protein
MEAYYSRVMYCRGDERLTIGAVLLVPRQEGVAEPSITCQMVPDVSRVATAFQTTQEHVREVQRMAENGIRTFVRNGMDLTIARLRNCAEARIGEPRWTAVIDGPEATLKHILEERDAAE